MRHMGVLTDVSLQRGFWRFHEAIKLAPGRHTRARCLHTGLNSECASIYSQRADCCDRRRKIERYLRVRYGGGVADEP